MTAPDANPAIEAARGALLALFDGIAARAPVEYQPALGYVRGELEKGSVIPANLVGSVLSGVGQAFARGDFGPATGSGADTA